MLSADKVIAPAAAKALEQKRRMTEIELTKPQEAQCCLSEPAQGNLFHKKRSRSRAYRSCASRGGEGFSKVLPHTYTAARLR
jgi:hypothetical protein